MDQANFPLLPLSKVFGGEVQEEWTLRMCHAPRSVICLGRLCRNRSRRKIRRRRHSSGRGAKAKNALLLQEEKTWSANTYQLACIRHMGFCVIVYFIYGLMPTGWSREEISEMRKLFLALAVSVYWFLKKQCRRLELEATINIKLYGGPLERYHYVHMRSHKPLRPVSTQTYYHSEKYVFNFIWWLYVCNYWTVLVQIFDRPCPTAPEWRCTVRGVRWGTI